MKICLPGGNGQLGRLLAEHFVEHGHEVVVLSRNPEAAPWRVVFWDGKSLGNWVEEIDGSDVVINLAGRSVNCRYHEANRREMMNSRIDSTRALGKAIQQCLTPPRVWLQSSTATIYAHTFGQPNSETEGVIGGNEADVPDYWKFSIEIATNWERTAREHVRPETRLVLLRTAMVMSPQPGGTFDLMSRLTRLGLGGQAGSGKQLLSWIHEQDFIRAIDWLIARDDLCGPINITAPNPVPNAEFMQELRNALGVRIGLPASKWMLELGAFFLRTDTELLLKSRSVIPERLQASGFEFNFPDWEVAARDLSERSRPTHSRTSTIAAIGPADPRIVR